MAETCLATCTAFSSANWTHSTGLYPSGSQCNQQQLVWTSSSSVPSAQQSLWQSQHVCRSRGRNEGLLVSPMRWQLLRSAKHALQPLAPVLISTRTAARPLSVRAGAGRRPPPESSAASEGRGWLVVVESPAKARSIGGYLGEGYSVQASYGHVRDLPAKKGSVLPERDFHMEWVVPEKAREKLAAMASALKDGRGLVLATDPDREGEAIAWHVVESLRGLGALSGGTAVRRVCFHEVTRPAVLAALQCPREVCGPLVEAYMARRALDYLMGFDLSPVLWRKLPGCKSAGRVQSVALRFVCDREAEIEAFAAQEYWSVHAQLRAASGLRFAAQLSSLDGARVGGRLLGDGPTAQAALQRVRSAALSVQRVKRGPVQRSPPPPFTTSTLQQEASAKLGFGAVRTMSIAQKLYEGIGRHGGLITYMRTDSSQISEEAVGALRNLASTRYGAQFIPASARVYKSKAKNAQEAHEAIRPTDPHTLPASLVGQLQEEEVRLYRLIWRRAMASQMANAVITQVGVDVGPAAGDLCLHSTASAVAFPGFLAAHKDAAALGSERLEDEEGEGEGEEGSSAPPLLLTLQEGEAVQQGVVEARQHFTEPPPRFSEGTLVKKLEEAGVGRPSTYAATIRTLQARSYVRLEKRRLLPELRGRMVTAFLGRFFPRYVDPTFTAHMETQLDEVSAGRTEWKAVLGDFWEPFHTAVQQAFSLDPSQVSEALEGALARHLFPTSAEAGESQRRCPSCGTGQLEAKVSAHGTGLFLGCSRYPDCGFRVGIGPQGERLPAAEEVRVLGVDAAGGGGEVSVRHGPYGPYVQLSGKAKGKPQRARLPQGVQAETLDLPAALALLGPTPALGEHPEGGAVELANGPYGWYVRHGDVRASLPKGVEREGLSLARALELLAAKKEKGGRGRRGAAAPNGALRKPAGGKGARKNGEAGAAPSDTGREKSGKKDSEPAVLQASEQLAEFLGGVERITRPEAVKAVWRYIKEQQLQDPQDGRKARLDGKLQELLGAQETTCLALSAKLSRHLSKAAS